jgi:hypothetical protein
VKYFYNAVFVPLSILIPISVGILFYKYLKKPEKILFFYLFLSGVSNALLAYLAYSHINNLPVFHIYTILECCFILFYFAELFNSSVISKWLFRVGTGFIFFSILNTVFFQNIFSFNSYSRSLEALLVIVICLYYFKLQLDLEKQFSEARGFWFVLGLFIYFSSSLTIFIISNISLSLDKHFLWIMWNIHASLVLMMYLLFAKGFIVCKK